MNILNNLVIKLITLFFITSLAYSTDLIKITKETQLNAYKPEISVSLDVYHKNGEICHKFYKGKGGSFQNSGNIRILDLNSGKFSVMKNFESGDFEVEICANWRKDSYQVLNKIEEDNLKISLYSGEEDFYFNDIGISKWQVNEDNSLEILFTDISVNNSNDWLVNKENIDIENINLEIKVDNDKVYFIFKKNGEGNFLFDGQICINNSCRSYYGDKYNIITLVKDLNSNNLNGDVSFIAGNGHTENWYFSIEKVIKNPPIVDFSFSIDNNNVNFSNKSYDENNENLTYNWNFGDGKISIDKNPIHTFSECGKNYNISLVAKNESLKEAQISKNIDIICSNDIEVISENEKDNVNNEIEVIIDEENNTNIIDSFDDIFTTLIDLINTTPIPPSTDNSTLEIKMCNQVDEIDTYACINETYTFSSLKDKKYIWLKIYDYPEEDYEIKYQLFNPFGNLYNERIIEYNKVLNQEYRLGYLWWDKESLKINGLWEYKLYLRTKNGEWQYLGSKSFNIIDSYDYNIKKIMDRYIGFDTKICTEIENYKCKNIQTQFEAGSQIFFSYELADLAIGNYEIKWKIISPDGYEKAPYTSSFEIKEGWSYMNGYTYNSFDTKGIWKVEYYIKTANNDWILFSVKDFEVYKNTDLGSIYSVDDIYKIVKENTSIDIIFNSGYSTYEIESNPKGVLSNVDGNKVTYTPASDFYGMDSFTYSYLNNSNEKYKGNVKITVEKDCIEEEFYAQDNQTNECKLFNSSCEVPTNWKVVETCKPKCEEGKMYIEGTNYAENPETNECKPFTNSCIPEDWLGVEGCNDASFVTTPAIVRGWNLLGNASNNTQSISKDGISLTWTFEGMWIQDGLIPPSQGFWAKADSDMNEYEFANDGDGIGVPEFIAGNWSLRSSQRSQTLGNILSIYDGATIVWTFIDNSWWNASESALTEIEVGRGYWVK